ncbi:MAG: alkaline phosphatase D family protein, partial [Hyphomonadaceae bacterium]
NLVITGDSHAAWASELMDGNERVGVEFGGTSITSPGAGNLFPQLRLDFGGAIAARNPHIKWNDQIHRGFLLLTLTRQRALAEFKTVSTVASKDFRVTTAATFQVMPDREKMNPLLPISAGDEKEK